MLNRHQGRELVVKALFLKDFYKDTPKESDDQYYDMVLSEYIQEGRIKKEEKDLFSQNRFDAILKKRAVIDDVISKAAPKWPIEKIFSIDRNVLRLGVHELLFEKNDVPPKVAINEAIEIAKSFGNKNSRKFISGVLGSLYEVLKNQSEEKVEEKAE